MWLFLAFMSSLTFGIGTFIFKLGADRKYLSADILLGLYFSGALLLLIFNGSLNFSTFSLITLSAAIIIAVSSTLSNSLYLKVLQSGPASLSAPLINSSNFLVVIMAVLFFDETLSHYNIVGIVLFFVALAFLSFDPSERLSIKDKRWYGLIILTILCLSLREGGLKIGQEMELNTILILFYAYLCAFFFNGLLICRRGTLQSANWHGIGVGVVVGLFSAGGLALFAYALELGPASIIAPIFAARSFVVVFLATLICKERLSACQIVAIVLLIVAFCLLCITE
jgi:uncharacterized membrane protein